MTRIHLTYQKLKVDFPVHIFPLGNTAIGIEFSKEISVSTNQYIISLADFLQANPCEGFIEVVPAYASLTVFYRPSPNFRFFEIKQWVEKTIASFKDEKNQENLKSSLIQIPCIYNGEDLNYVAVYNQLTMNEVIQIHSNTIYRVYMLGFLPGFAYLGGLDARIATPRRATPRTKVPAGSIGIAGIQTGIYPSASPGGWQLIGHTEKKMFSRFQEPQSLLQAGDLVQFIVI